MGNNVAVMFLTDTISQVREKPKEFVDELMRNIHGGRTTVGNVQVMPLAHADDPRLYFSCGNVTTDLSFPYTSLTQLRQLREVEFRESVVDRAEKLLAEYKKMLQVRKKELSSKKSKTTT